MIRRSQVTWRVILPAGLLLLGLQGCGGFQLRSSPTATPAVKVTVPAGSTATPGVRTATTAAAPTAAPTPRPTPVPVGGMGPGGSARVSSTTPLNVRSQASTTSQRIGSLDPNSIVKVRAGPVTADGFTWWQVDNSAGVVGWVATGPADAPWLIADTGSTAPASPPTPSGPRLVSRAVKLGDKVQVTTVDGKYLTVREAAGLNAERVALVNAGGQFTVKGGPVQKDGLTWWQLDSNDTKGWAAEGDGKDRWLTPLEP